MLPQRPPLDWRREYLPIRQRYSVAPNISGTFAGGNGHDDCWTGPFKKMGSSLFAYGANAASEFFMQETSFNASEANTMYGDADTVQPKTLRAFALIRYE